MLGDKRDASSSPRPDNSQALNARRAPRRAQAGDSQPQLGALYGDAAEDRIGWSSQSTAMIVTTAQQPWYGYRSQEHRSAKFIITVTMTGLIAFFTGIAIGASSAPQPSSATSVVPVTVTATETATATTTVEAPASTATPTESQPAAETQPVVAEEPQAVAEPTATEEQPTTQPVEVVSEMDTPNR